MIKILLVTQDDAAFSDMIHAFETRNTQIEILPSGALALSSITDNSYDLLITDEHLSDMTGKELIEKTVTQNPLMNCVAISSLEHKEFHDTYEGMGVLMQFPPTPGMDDVQKLLDHLDKIYSLLKK